MKRIVVRDFISLLQKPATMTALAIVLCGCSMREINLSGIDNPESNTVSYVFADKQSDDRAEATIYLEKIDDIELRLIDDPCLYLVKAGEHKLQFTARDFHSRNIPDTTHVLEAVIRPGKYYQVLPTRSGDKLTFKLTEIDSQKPKAINRRELRSMVGYLISGE